MQCMFLKLHHNTLDFRLSFLFNSRIAWCIKECFSLTLLNFGTLYLRFDLWYLYWTVTLLTSRFGAWGLTPVSHMLHLQCICGPCALRMGCRSSTDSLCFHTGRVCSPLLIHGCLPQTQHLSIILISNPNVVRLNRKYFFSIVILFYHSTVTLSFIDIFTFKLN